MVEAMARRINASISDALYERLERAAKEEGRSLSSLVSYLLEHGLDLKSSSATVSERSFPCTTLVGDRSFQWVLYEISTMLGERKYFALLPGGSLLSRSGDRTLTRSDALFDDQGDLRSAVNKELQRLARKEKGG